MSRSPAILRANPKVGLRAFGRVQPNSFVLSHKAMQDHAWKKSRGRADWVVVTTLETRELGRERQVTRLRDDRAVSLAAGMHGSSSWRVTTPMRRVGRLARKVAVLG